MTKNTPSSEEAELREKIRKLYGVKISRYTNFEPRLNQLMELIQPYAAEIAQEARKQAASDIFNLAHEYAQEDKTMVGSEELRSYHYFNAIHKIGEFDGC